jgi:hypothetical protein
MYTFLLRTRIEMVLIGLLASTLAYSADDSPRADNSTLSFLALKRVILKRPPAVKVRKPHSVKKSDFSPKYAQMPWLELFDKIKAKEIEPGDIEFIDFSQKRLGFPFMEERPNGSIFDPIFKSAFNNMTLENFIKLSDFNEEKFPEIDFSTVRTFSPPVVLRYTPVGLSKWKISLKHQNRRYTIRYVNDWPFNQLFYFNVFERNLPRWTDFGELESDRSSVPIEKNHSLVEHITLGALQDTIVAFKNNIDHDSLWFRWKYGTLENLEDRLSEIVEFQTQNFPLVSTKIPILAQVVNLFISPFNPGTHTPKIEATIKPGFEERAELAKRKVFSRILESYVKNGANPFEGGNSSALALSFAISDLTFRRETLELLLSYIQPTDEKNNIQKIIDLRKFLNSNLFAYFKNIDSFNAEKISSKDKECAEFFDRVDTKRKQDQLTLSHFNALQNLQLLHYHHKADLDLETKRPVEEVEEQTCKVCDRPIEPPVVFLEMKPNICELCFTTASLTDGAKSFFMRDLPNLNAEDFRAPIVQAGLATSSSLLPRYLAQIQNIKSDLMKSSYFKRCTGKLLDGSSCLNGFWHTESSQDVDCSSCKLKGCLVCHRDHKGGDCEEVDQANLFFYRRVLIGSVTDKKTLHDKYPETKLWDLNEDDLLQPDVEEKINAGHRPAISEEEGEWYGRFNPCPHCGECQSKNEGCSRVICQACGKVFDFYGRYTPGGQIANRIYEVPWSKIRFPYASRLPGK